MCVCMQYLCVQYAVSMCVRVCVGGGGVNKGNKVEVEVAARAA